MDDEQPTALELASQRSKRSKRRWLAVTAVLVVFGTCSLVSPSYRSPSGSMLPTVMVGDHFLVSTLAYRLGEVERGDLIVFHFPLDPSQKFFKRVIGLPGDEVRIRGRQVAIRRAGAEGFEVLARKPLDRGSRGRASPGVRARRPGGGPGRADLLAAVAAVGARAVAAARNAVGSAT